MPVMPDKAVYVSAVLLCVQRYRETTSLLLQNWHLEAKNQLAFSFGAVVALMDRALDL